MKIIGFNGSPRKNGNTAGLLKHCLNTLEQEGISTEFIQVGGSKIKPCMGCNTCRKLQNERCVITDDPLNEWFEKILEADGFLLATSTYVWNMTPEMKCLVDRVCYLARCKLRGGQKNNPLRYKIGAALAVDAYTGAPQAVQTMQTIFNVTQMIIPGANYWPVGKGLNPGDINNDALGLGYAEDLAHNIAWLLRKIKA